MKYIYLNLIALFGIITTYFAFHYGYFLSINNLANNFPRNDFLTRLFFFITDVGGVAVIIIGSLFLIVTLVIRGKYKKASYIMVSILGGLISQTILKNILAVNRPEGSLVSSFGFSFPSGHSNMITILLLSSCFYFFADFANKNKRYFYFIVSFLIIILVGLSRIYLNVHWISDVLAGWFLGLFWATLPQTLNNFVIFKHKF